jgi:hypothetical protein
MLERTSIPNNQVAIDSDSDDDDKGKYKHLSITPPIWRSFTPNCEHSLVTTIANGAHLNCIGLTTQFSFTTKWMAMHRK